MAVKHVKAYYQEISNQYHEMLDTLKDFEKEAHEGLVEPERIEQIKQTIKPLKDNYERWSYMMFLLNKPNRNSKVKKWQKLQNQINKNKNFDTKNTLEAVTQENEKTLQKLKENH